MAKKRAGRPNIQIDKEQFENLCGIQSTLVEIAAWFRCSEDTIERWAKKKYGMDFAEIFKQKRGLGKISLRRAQWQAAQKGNPTMLVWLGKNVLDQKDTIETEVKSDNLVLKLKYE